MKILLMAGHGQGDSGAVGNGYKEADLTREFLQLLKPKLSKYADVTVFDTNKNPYTYLKSNKYNFKEYDYVLEIHFNAAVNDRVGDGRTTGAEILVHPKEKGVSVEEKILNKLEALGLRNRGVKVRDNLQNMNICKGNYGVSYALLEVCFIDDKDDMTLYAQKKDVLASGVANGIAEGFKLGIKESENVGFKDIKGHYAEASIKDLLSMGIVKGDGDGNFRPEDNLKRGDAAIMIRNAIKYITGK